MRRQYKAAPLQSRVLHFCAKTSTSATPQRPHSDPTFHLSLLQDYADARARLSTPCKVAPARAGRGLALRLERVDPRTQSAWTPHAACKQPPHSSAPCPKRCCSAAAARPCLLPLPASSGFAQPAADPALTTAALLGPAQASFHYVAVTRSLAPARRRGPAAAAGRAAGASAAAFRLGVWPGAKGGGGPCRRDALPACLPAMPAAMPARARWPIKRARAMPLDQRCRGCLLDHRLRVDRG